VNTRVLGVDHGSKRVGLALSDPGRVIASPLETVAKATAIDRIVEVIAEYEVSEIVIGLPTALRGHEGVAASAARDFGAEVALATGLRVVFVDEKYTTHTAEQALLAAGRKRRERREAIDKVAATVILQTFLDRPS